MQRQILTILFLNKNINRSSVIKFRLYNEKNNQVIEL